MKRTVPTALARLRCRISWFVFALASIATSITYAADRVEVKVNDISYELMVSVDDYPAVGLDATQAGEVIDITHMVARGQNNLKLWGDNSQLNADVLVNGSIESSYTATTQQTYFEKSYSINLTDAPEKRELHVVYDGLSAGEVGRIYINSAYTGHDVGDGHTFMLPPGNYKVGLGIHEDEVVSKQGFEYDNNVVVEKTIEVSQYTGRYLEQQVSLDSYTQTANFNSSAPLAPQKTYSIHLLPVYEVERVNIPTGGPRCQSGTSGPESCYLTQAQIDRVEAMLEATVDEFLEPLTYGLNDFQVSVGSTVTHMPVIENDLAVNTAGFVKDAGLANLLNEHDIIVLLHASPNVGAAAGNGNIHLAMGFPERNPTVRSTSGSPILTATEPEEELPLEVILHEILHVYEQANKQQHGVWNGKDGVHGAEQHGYQSQRVDQPNLFVLSEWMHFYSDYLRGTLLELDTFGCQSDCKYTGAFHTVREGMDNLHAFPEGPTTIRNKWHNGNKYLAKEGSNAVVQASPSDLDTVIWDIEPYTANSTNSVYVRLKDEASGSYLHINESTGNSLLVGGIGEHAWSSHWELVDAGGDYWLINRWTGHYLHMEDGSNLLSLDTDVQEPDIDSWWSARWIMEARPLSAPLFNTTIQAETQAWSSGAVEAEHSGSEGGYVNTANSAGETIDFSVTVPAAGTHRIAVRYANGTSANRSARVGVNGLEVLPSENFIGTGSWTDWREVEFPLYLGAGTNVIQLEGLGSAGLANIDKMTVSAH